MLTEKVVFCLVMVPTLWVIYGVSLACFTDLDGPAIALTILSMPLFAYIGIIVSDAGMVDLQDFRPYVMRLFPSSRKRLAQLPETRKRLQEDLRSFIRSIGKSSPPFRLFSDINTQTLRIVQPAGPAVGEIYFGKDLDWKAIQEKSIQLKDSREDKKNV